MSLSASPRLAAVLFAAFLSCASAQPFFSNNLVTVECVANSNYVTLNPTNLNLFANRNSIGVLQEFTIFTNSSGTYSLKAQFNGDIISADGAGTVPLIANRTAVGPWEQYNLVSEGGNVYALEALANSNYVTAASGSLIASQASPATGWEKFIIQTNATAYNAINWRVVMPQFNPNEAIVAACTPQDYGAKGDGVTDDTAAFQDAANAVSALDGGAIYIPPATYAFYTNLSIPTGVTLHGDWQDWTTNSTGAVGTIFKVYYGAGQTNAAPFIFLNGSTALKGVSIWYPNQNPASITGYPFTIVLYGDCVVQNVVLVNSYQGIQVTAATSGAKHILSTVIGSPLYKGIDLDMIADISHCEDIRFSPDVWPASKLPGAPAPGDPYAAWMRANGTAMRILRVDGEVCMNLYFSGYHVGIEANSSTNGVPGATFYNGSVSNCATALLAQDMSGQSGLQFTSFTLDGDTAVNRTTNSDDATVGFDNCQITGRSGLAVYSTGSDWHSWMAFQNCTINGTLQLDAGVFNVVNSTLTVPAGSNHCILNPNAVRAAFTGCDFSPARSIANSGSTNRVVIDGRHTIPNPLPQINWAQIKQDYLARHPAKTNLFVVTYPPWNATGNGTNDDTAAIQAALAAASTNGGGIVFLPGGKYHLTNTLDVPGGVELRGPYEMRHRTWPAPDNHAKGAVLQPYGGQGTTSGPPAIALEANSGLVGMTISYETQNSNTFAFPPTIQGRGGNVYVIGVVCPNPYYYVDLDTYTCTNHLVYMADGWALNTGYRVGNGSSGSLIDCMANWTYWWDNYDSASDLNYNPAWMEPVRNFAEHNLEMYVLGDCTELLVKDFVIPSHTLMHCFAENGRGPNATCIGAMCDETSVGFLLDAPGNVTDVNATWAVFAETNYPDLYTNTVGVCATTNFQGTARFFNSTLFGGPHTDFIVAGGDVGFELVHMLDHSAIGSVVNGGTFHLVNSGAYITYWIPNDVFPPYDVTFGPTAGLPGTVSEVIGCYAYNGVTNIIGNSSGPVWAWADYSLNVLDPQPTYELTPPPLQFSLTDGLAFSWPGNIGYFGLFEASSLTSSAAWTPINALTLYSKNQWNVRLPPNPINPFNNPGYYYRLQAP
jgi:hypothetical protein